MDVVKVPFLGGFYETRSRDADTQKAVNVYLETDQTSDRAPAVLYGRPGLTSFYQFLSGPSSTAEVRTMIPIGTGADVFYAVVGDRIYSITTSPQSATLVGTIGTSSGQVGTTSNGDQILIVDGSLGYILTTATNTIAQITDPDFPNGVTNANYMNGFFIVSGDGTGMFYINETPGEGTAWNGLDFASAEGAPDAVIGQAVVQNELWLAGRASTEVWTYTGNADFPFERSSNVMIEHGCEAGATFIKFANTIYWLGRDQYGIGLVWRANGYTPDPISTGPLSRAIQSYTTISDAFAFGFQIQGHSFYVLQFPTEGKTWAYDTATGLWFEWACMDQQTGEDTRWLPNCFCVSGNRLLVGSYNEPHIYTIDPEVYDDNGRLFRRLRRTQTMAADQYRLFFTRLQVDMQTGSGTATGQGSAPELMLRYSIDGGNTWSNYKTASVGLTGQYSARAEFKRLGQGRNRVWEISMTDPVPFAVFGAVADVKKGTT